MAADSIRIFGNANQSTVPLGTVLFWQFFIPRGGFREGGKIGIIRTKMPRLAGTKPGRADQNRQTKAGTVIIHRSAEKGKENLL